MKKFLVILLTIAMIALPFACKRTEQKPVVGVRMLNRPLTLTPQTSISFTPLSGDFTAPNRGAQNWGLHPWNDITQPTIPTGNTVAKNWYTRFNWLDIESNTVQGQYTWTVFDNFVNQAIDNGGMFSFGLMAVCNGCGSGGWIPTYLKNLMTAEGKPGPTIDGDIFPNYQSVNWSLRYCAWMRAVANHIATTSRNGKSYTSAFLGYDLRHYSEFGEGTGFPTGGGTSQCPSTAQVTQAYMLNMIDSAKAIFPNVQLTIPMEYFTPAQMASNSDYSLSLGHVTTQVAYYTLTTSNNYGRIGWRRDNIGDAGYNTWFTGNTADYLGTPLKPLIMNMWKLAPIGGEPSSNIGGVTTTSGCSSTNPYCDFHNEDTLFHITYFGNGNAPGGINNGSGATWTNLQANWRAASAEQGYRLILNGGSVTTSPSIGSEFDIILNWKNIGLAPVYENWNVVYELRTSAGGVVWTGNSAFHPRLFLPNTTDSVVTDVFTLNGFSAGTYNLYIKIVDPVGYKAPFPLAITGRQSDGSYLLKGSLVVTSTGVPTANAGPNQTITSPASSVTVDGSASIAATSYVWSRVSGPNSPTITSPTSVSTTITGLITGTYVFRLTINGGVSSSDVTITVNPAVVQANAGNNQTITLPTSSVTLNGSGSTGATTYLWTRVSGPNTPTITTPTNVTTTVTGLIAGTYIFQLSINGGASTSQVTITVNPAPPAVANAGPDQVIYLPSSSVTLDGTGSTGTITSYLWTAVSGPGNQTIVSPTTATTTVTGLTLGTYVFQLALNGGTSSDQVQVIVNPTPSGVTVFTTQTPAVSVSNDGTPIELGMKFRSSVAGYVTGARFYKVTGNTGTHTGELYSRTGTRLAQAVFTGESSSGWQQVLYTTPIAITANTTYVTAYFSSAGNYISTNGGLVGAITNSPLTGLAGGTDGANGVYQYSATATFPTSSCASCNSPNYWVDVIFSPNTAPTARITGPSTVTFPATSVSLDGSTSGDPDGSISTYQWTRVSGPNTPTIVSPTSSITNITGLISGTYVFQLQVTDNLGAVGTATKTVTVTRAPSSFVIGTGSGSLVVNGMGTYIPGDTLKIVAGTYTGFTLAHVNNLLVVPQTASPIFTSTSTFCDWNHMTVKYLNFISSGGTRAIDATCGRIDSSRVVGFYFQDWPSSCWDASGNYPYTQNVDSTYKWLLFNIDSTTYYHCGRLVQGSFGVQPITNVDIMWKVSLTNITEIGSTAVSFEGVGFSGVCFNCTATNINSTSTTYRVASGDVGWISGSGWWSVSFFYKWGSPGYIMRLFPMMELRDQGTIKFFNNAKFRGTEYGMVNLQFYPSDTVVNQRRGTGADLWNNTMGDQFNDNNGYWSTMFNFGQVAPNAHYNVHNNFGFAIGENNNNANKPKIAFNLGGWTTIGSDTSNNQYYVSATAAKLDSTTIGFSNSLGGFTYYKTTNTSPFPLFHTGLTNPLTSIDYFRQPMRVPPDLGYYQFYGNIPSPPENMWIIRQNVNINYYTP